MVPDLVSTEDLNMKNYHNFEKKQIFLFLQALFRLAAKDEGLAQILFFLIKEICQNSHSANGRVQSPV